MNFIASHKIASALLGIYLLLWGYLYYLVFINLSKDPQCISGLIVVIFAHYILTAVYLISYLIAYFVSKRSDKKGYLYFIALVVLPALAGGRLFGFF